VDLIYLIGKRNAAEHRAASGGEAARFLAAMIADLQKKISMADKCYPGVIDSFGISSAGSPSSGLPTGGWISSG
jgi:hypothetical protein